MGAVVTMRPDLVNAVLMGVPFVDIVTTMLDASIPLTTIEVCPLHTVSENGSWCSRSYT